MGGTAGVWLADKRPNGQRENWPGLSNPLREEAERCVNSEVHLAADAWVLHTLVCTTAKCLWLGHFLEMQPQAGSRVKDAEEPALKLGAFLQCSKPRELK